MLTWRFFCAALCAWPALGIGADAPTELSPMEVRDSAPADPVAAARARLQQIPGGVAVVGREAYADRYALTLRDMLGLVPGVYAQPRFGEEVRLSIRGSGLARNFHLRGITLLQDGIPLNLADGSGDFQEIDPALLRHIEVYKGANGLALGASSLGGAINLITPTATTTETWRAALDSGAWKSRRGNLQWATTQGRGDAFLNATLSSVDGYRDNTQGDSRRVSGNLGFAGPRVATRVYLAHNDILQRIPGTLSLDAALQSPRQTNPANIANRAARDIRSTRASQRTTLSLGAGTLAITGYALRKALFHPLSFGIIDQDGDFWGGGLQWEQPGRSVGLNWRAGDNDARIFAPLSGAGFAEQRADAREQAEHLSLYAQQAWQVAPQWTLIGALQWVRDDRVYTDRRNAERNARRDFSEWVPKLGVLWAMDPQRQVYANLSRSFEPPTFAELNQSGVTGFVPLQAQTAWTLEVGSRGQWGRHQYDLSVYRAEIDEALVAFQTNPEQGIPAATFNADRSVHQGLEAGWSSALWQHPAGWQLHSQLAWTWNDFRFAADPVYANNRLPGIPEHVILAELKWHTPLGVQIRPQLEWVPQGPWIDFANSARAPSYAVWGLGMSADLASGISVFVEGRNLGNRRYVSNLSTVAQFNDQAAFYPGEGRAVYSGIRWVLP